LPRIAFTSVGCKLNRYEIQLISESLQSCGFEAVPFNQAADCYVINTCTVTADADLSSRQLIRRAKRRNPGAKVIVTGCYAQLRPEEIRELEVDFIVSNREKEKLPERVLRLFGISYFENESDFFDQDSVITGMNGLTRAFVKIEDGCDEQCTFCTIWMARGPVISRPAASIIKEVNKLESNGFKEIALTGVHIGKYQDNDLNLIGLLRALILETSMKRIRLSSLNPLEIDDELISLMKSNDRICPHIHLSLQSGDDAILKAMGRKYNQETIISVIDKLISAIPDITIGADIIIAFPGESDGNFQNTYRLVESSELHHLHVFPYSDRPGTPAAFMGGKVVPAVKAQRTEIFRKLGREKKLGHLKKFIGRKLSVLFENRESRRDGMMTGLSENYLRVMRQEIPQFKGNLVDVYPRAVQDDKLIADTTYDNDSTKIGLTT
jgi:threonylcarbamoyladenosine tRNA methylthiotransferase MtaB